ncbi:peptidase S8/S53 domain-containing protein [Phlyctochytrium arcticum]|nr:peptidase S8/S53 domain-containing protein [Phlyctochytrium arcticum]
MIGVRSIFVLALASLATASPVMRKAAKIPDEYIVGFTRPTNNLIPRNVSALIDQIAQDVQTRLGRRDGTGLQILNRYDLGESNYQGFAFKSHSSAALAAIKEHPEVAYMIQNEVAPPLPGRVSGPPPPPPQRAVEDTMPVPPGYDYTAVQVDDSLWNLDIIDGLRDGFFNYHESAGEGVDIYIVDTGVDIQHAEFEGRARWGHPAGGNIPTAEHGTHVAGIAAGKTFGVARKANIISVLRGESVAEHIAALQWIYEDTKDNQANSKRAVVNLSWGTYDESEPLKDALRALQGRDLAVAAAAGDERQDSCSYSPGGTVPYGALSVAAHDINGNWAEYSNHGWCTRVIAPGNFILSAKQGGGSIYMTGTGMASPHAAGGMAIAFSSGSANNRFNAMSDVVDFGARDTLKNVPTNMYNKQFKLRWATDSYE